MIGKSSNANSGTRLGRRWLEGKVFSVGGCFLLGVVSVAIVIDSSEINYFCRRDISEIHSLRCFVYVTSCGCFFLSSLVGLRSCRFIRYV